MVSDTRDSLAQSHPTPRSHSSSHLTTLDHSSVLSRLDQALPPLPDLGLEGTTHNTNPQMERGISRTSENREDSPTASEYLRLYYEAREREAREWQEAEENRLRVIAERPVPTLNQSPPVTTSTNHPCLSGTHPWTIWSSPLFHTHVPHYPSTQGFTPRSTGPNPEPLSPTYPYIHFLGWQGLLPHSYHTHLPS